MHELFIKHQERLELALLHCKNRSYWSPFQESPSSKYHPEGARLKAKERYDELLGEIFPLSQPASIGLVGKEVSPYTQKELGIRYPQHSPNQLIEASKCAQKHWTRSTTEARVGVCMEILDQLAHNCFLNTYASMHTAGMSFMMGFAGSGANALDRGLEALAHAYKAMADIPYQTVFRRSFARGPVVRIDKHYHIVGRGVAVVICCGTFPTWNALPALFANLATGNPVILKPHPNGILPVALVVQTGRRVLAKYGFDPNLILLAADEADNPITIPLMENPHTAIIDFTGSPTFGTWIEENFHKKLVFTETAGCNSVIMESTDNYDGMIHAIAQSLCLFSSQMCTSAQNIFIPAQGVQHKGHRISFEKVQQDIIDRIDVLTADPKVAAALCGCIMSPRTYHDMNQLRELALQQNALLRDSVHYVHPQYPHAATATPMLVAAEFSNSTLYRKEYFGPMAFVIKAPNAQKALEQAALDAKECGSIASYAYSRNTTFLEEIEEAFLDAGASIGCNLIQHLPINFSAAYSDFHVTGLNPAGNACLTDIAFVASRFRIVQIKKER